MLGHGGSIRSSPLPPLVRRSPSCQPKKASPAAELSGFVGSWTSWPSGQLYHLDVQGKNKLCPFSLSSPDAFAFQSPLPCHPVGSFVVDGRTSCHFCPSGQKNTCSNIQLSPGLSPSRRRCSPGSWPCLFSELLFRAKNVGRHQPCV